MNMQDQINHSNDMIELAKQRADDCFATCSQILGRYIEDKDYDKAIKELDVIKSSNDDYIFLNPNEVAVPLNAIIDFHLCQAGRINQELTWLERVNE